jgi:general secretion pathway protein L
LTTLYIRHPARADSDSALVQFALVGDGGNLAQQGEGALRSLGDLVASSRRVVLLLSGADVLLLQVKAPPLSHARLKAALPSLVEEQVLGDPADCVLVAGPVPAADGSRTVAVVQRGWFEALVKSLLAQGARSVSALPAQLCLPLQPGSVSASIGAHDITLRTGQWQGLGLAIASAPAQALQTVRALAGDSPLMLYVAPEQAGEYQVLAQEAGPGITVEAAHWAHTVAAARALTFDLVPGLGSAGTKARDWQRWRWPLRLAVLAVVVNLVGLNIEYFRMKHEADALRLAMNQTFKAAYPKEVAFEPLLQMQKNIQRAKAGNGQLASDEFTFLTAALAEGMRAMPRQPQLAGLDYRERVLSVKLKTDSVDPAMLSALQGALAARKLNVEQSAVNIWQVKSKGGTP